MGGVRFNPVFASIEEAAPALEAGELSSVELVALQLDRIERPDHKRHAFVDGYADEARGSALAMDRLRRAGIRRGPLHGTTVAVKDLFDIGGKPITGGSVRIPAGLCGRVGLKTTHGMVSRHGLIELCPTHDTVGPLARSVRDGAILLDVIAGADPLDPVSHQAPVRRVLDGVDTMPRGARLWILPEQERAGVAAAVLAAMDGVEACVFPTNAISAIPVAEVDELATPLSRFGRFVNLLNLCALAVPAGPASTREPAAIAPTPGSVQSVVSGPVAAWPRSSLSIQARNGLSAGSGARS